MQMPLQHLKHQTPLLQTSSLYADETFLLSEKKIFLSLRFVCEKYRHLTDCSASTDRKFDVSVFRAVFSDLVIGD